MDRKLISSADTVGMFCRLYMNAKRDMPIRPSEMGILIFTHKQLTPVTPLLISQFFRITKPSVTAMVNALIKEGYLKKEPSLSDGRSYMLKTTEKGKNLVENAFEEYFKTMELLKEKMGPQSFDQMIELIQVANGIMAEGK